METSENIDLLVTALLKSQEQFPEIPKTKKAKVKTKTGYYEYDYADLPDIISATRPALLTNGLTIVQTVGQIVGVSTEHPGIEVSTMLVHKSGQFIRGTGMILIPRLDPQSTGSAITYARRYGYCAIIGIAAEEDDDAGAATYTDEQVEVRAKAAMQRTVPPKSVAPRKPVPSDNPGDYVMPFGKHKGTKLSDIPLGYLEWVLSNTNKKDTKDAINDYIDWLSNQGSDNDEDLDYYEHLMEEPDEE